MALTPLADVTDLPAVWRTDPDAAKALDVASAVIRDAAGTVIGPSQTATVTTPGGPENILRLPGPITAVDTVTVDGVTRTDYRIVGAGLWSGCGWGGDPVPVTVKYTFGVEVPADIADLCVQLAVSWLQHNQTGGGSTAGLVGARLDDWSEQYSQEAAGAVTAVFLPASTRQWLAARFGGGPTVLGSL